MKLALFGFGGHAREVAVQMNKPLNFFVDDKYVNQYTLPISQFNPEDFALMVAVADPEERKKIVERLPKTTKYFTFIHPTCLIFGEDVVIEEGSFVGANSIITTNVRIGKHALLNRGNQIGHDTFIGNYFSAMPGSIVSGNVQIGDSCYMGTNSSVKEKIVIKDNIIIGSNAAVVKDIETPGIYVGVPALRKIK